MNRRIAAVLGVAAALGLATAALPGNADAARGHRLRAHQQEPKAGHLRPDNRPDPLQTKRSDLRQRAVDALVAGKATTVGEGRDRRIRLKNGKLVDYPVDQTAQQLTFLLDFGDGAGNPDFPQNTAGPVHNQIPKPAASDNSSYWMSDFSRRHYLDMLYRGLPDQSGESVHDLYDQMSSGRFDLEGDVSGWVTVPHPESYYQESVDDDGDPSTPPIGDESGATMQSFLQDGANAWYAAQRAKGASDATIRSYLARFDVWDRDDYDHDGNYNEPDGYIDHFQAIHAGQGEEGGGATWTIQSHRAAVNPTTGVDGPAGNKSGGIEIGDTGFWIRDYITEPEDGGMGVFAHEFGHDLGLPDSYDTASNTDTSTGYWTLMASGEWLGHGDGTVGTTPDQMGAPDKLFLGWYGPGDLAVADGTDKPKPVTLGPSYHATRLGAQAVAVRLPRGSETVDVVTPDQGTHYLYSGTGDARTATATSPTITVPAGDPTLSARVSYATEDDFDYAYLEVSTDGGATWDHVDTSRSTTTDPHHANQGFGITGCSGTRDDGGSCDNAWTDLTADLSAHAGQTVTLRFAMVNDQSTHQLGFSVDSIALGGTLLTDVEDGAPGWTLSGFRVMDGSSYTTTFDQYYLAENRQYLGYDKTLAQGPYSWDYPLSAPNRVDQYPYQDGLLVWYANGLYTDNNTSSHPGGGQALVVDANPAYQIWWDSDGAPWDYGDGRLNSYDATFDVDQTDGLHLTKETPAGDVHYDVDARAGVPVFEDSDRDAYWDDWGGQIGPVPGFFSTKVAGVGTEIQVLSSDERTGRMELKVGSRFVAATSAAAVSGTPAVGQRLTAGDPTWFQDDVTTTYQWLADGRPIPGATSSSYVLSKSELGREVSVAVTGAKTGYEPTRVVSAAVKVRNKAK
ncbi:immune inhibitor A domain-containing protein [Nocardioides sp. AN3]